MKLKCVHQDTLSCEAIIRKTPDNNLIILSQCGGSKEPARDNRVYAFLSNDDGETWSEPIDICPYEKNAVYQTETCVIDNNIYAFITTHNGNFLEWQNFIVKSSDNGQTWEKYKELECFSGFVFVRGMIKLTDGTILFPYHHYPISREESKVLAKQNKYIWDMKEKIVEVGALRSDSKLNFNRGRDLIISMNSNWVGGIEWPEPTIIEIEEGLIVMFLRLNGTGFIWKSESNDNGNSWSEIVKTDIPNPNNKPKLLKTVDERIVLLNTPNSKCGFDYRNPLEVWVSNDKMKTWSKKTTLVNEKAWISYPDGFIVNNKLVFSFDYNRRDVYYGEIDLDRDK